MSRGVSRLRIRRLVVPLLPCQPALYRMYAQTAPPLLRKRRLRGSYDHRRCPLRCPPEVSFKGGLRQCINVRTIGLLRSVVAEFGSLGKAPRRCQGAACGGAEVVKFVVLLACPLGPVPLAARGLAVLARAGRRG
jgi:hypothetical protein